jgi:hypothetical protein
MKTKMQSTLQKEKQQVPTTNAENIILHRKKSTLLFYRKIDFALDQLENSIKLIINNNRYVLICAPLQMHFLKLIKHKSFSQD